MSPILGSKSAVSTLRTTTRLIQMKKNPESLDQCQGRCSTTACGNMTQMLFDWIRLSRAQDQGLKFWQTKSDTIIVRNPVPADCINKVIAQNWMKHYLKDSQHLDLHQRWLLQVGGIRSSSIRSRSSNTLRVLHHLSGNRCEAPRCKTRKKRSRAIQQILRAQLASGNRCETLNRLLKKA